MKRLGAFLMFIAACAGAACAPSAAHSKLAPADEYFGKLKLSILGIRNTIRDVAANVDRDPGRWKDLANKADYAEDALRDWQHKYPSDTWLPKTLYALGHLYARLDSDDGRRRRSATIAWLVRDYPDTCYGRAGRDELRGGSAESRCP